MAASWIVVIRIVQGAIAFMTIGVSALALDLWKTIYNGDLGDSFPRANLSLTSAIFTTLVSIYFLITTFVLSNPRFSLPSVALGLDVCCWISWFTKFSYMVSGLDTVSTCRGEVLRYYPQAIATFTVVEWLLFSGTVGYGIYLLRKPKVLGAQSSYN